jgi:hypothetical protein
VDDFETAPPFFYAIDALDDQIAYAESEIKRELAAAAVLKEKVDQHRSTANNHQNYLRRLLEERRQLKGLSDV